MEIPVHDLRDDVQAAGGCIPVEQDGEADADGKNVADHVQPVAAGHGFIPGKQLLKDREIQGQKDARDNGLDTEIIAAGQEADDQQHHVQDHGDGRYRQGNEVGQDDRQTGDAAHGGPARDQEKEHCGGNDQRRE